MSELPKEILGSPVVYDHNLDASVEDVIMIFGEFNTAYIGRDVLKSVDFPDAGEFEYNGKDPSTVTINSEEFTMETGDKAEISITGKVNIVRAKDAKS